MTERRMAGLQLDFSPRGLYAAVIETVRNPRSVADQLLDMNLPLTVIWTMLAAVSAVSVVLVEGGLLLVRTPGAEATAQLPNPFVIFGLQIVLSSLLASVTHQIGRLLGGNGTFPGALLLITWILVIGVRESATANRVMVGIKLLVLGVFITVGMTHFDTKNWENFAPNGWDGISRAMGMVFFAYIGFDAVSTAAEETKNPKRDMPIGILGSLAICAVLYVVVSAIATGMVPYMQLKGADPLAKALEGSGERFAQIVVAAGAMISFSAVLLVFQLGQPRIFFAMSRDGLLPKWFAKVHPKYRTPHVTTLVTGLLVALASGVMDDDLTFDLTSIGTLFAFVVACGGVLVLRMSRPDLARPFRVPAIWVVAPIAIGGCIYVMQTLPRESWERFGIWLAIGFVIYFGRKLTMKPAT